MKIRRATLQDAKDIAKVHVDSWRTTYQNLLPEEFLDGLSYEQRTTLWESNLQKQYVYVAETPGKEIVGFSVGGKETTGEYASYVGELYAIYILQDYQHQGLGSLLFAPVIKHLKENDLNSMLVWVLEGNDAAYFYEAKGGRKIDSKEIRIAGQQYVEYAYGWTHLDDFEN